jgi:HK97 family phage portal protein
MLALITNEGYKTAIPSQSRENGLSQTDRPNTINPLPKVQIYQFGGRYNYSTLGEADFLKYADLTYWFFTPMLGQPRPFDVNILKVLGNSVWVNMCVNTIINEIVNSEWNIVPAYGYDKETIKQELKDNVVEFFKYPTTRGDDLGDIIAPFLWDYLVIGEGVFIKTFSEDLYKTAEVVLDKNKWSIIDDDEVTKIKLKSVSKLTEKVRAINDKTRGVITAKQINNKRVGLLELRPSDSSTFLVNSDGQGNLPIDKPAYYQYSWLQPKLAPKPFYKREVIWMPNQQKSGTLYGTSPIVSLMLLLETLNAGTRFNKLFFENNAMPDAVVSLQHADEKTIQEANSWWKSQFKGRPHKTLFLGDDHKVTLLNLTNRDMEWLEGQSFYMKLVMATYNVTPDELGFTDTSNRSVGMTQSRVFIRKAIKPLLRKIEELFNTQVIPEFYPEEPEVQFKFSFNDEYERTVEEQVWAQRIKDGRLTINEWRVDNGYDPVSWGDEFQKPGGFGGGFMPTITGGVEKAERKDYLKKQYDSVERAKEYLKGFSIRDLQIISVKGEGNLKQAAIELLQTYRERVNGKPKAITEKDYNGLESYLNDLFNKIESDYLKALDDEKQNISKGDSSTFQQKALAIIGMLGMITIPQIVKFTNKAFEKGVENVESQVNMNLLQEMEYAPQMNGYAEQIANGYTLPDGTRWNGIKGVGKELGDKVVSIVSKGISEGQSISAIRDNLVEALNVTKNHAIMIARTETNRIMNQAQLEAFQKSGVKAKKVWVSQVDDKTSDICKALNGQERELGQSFEALGKTFISPPAHVNCRSTFIIKKDEVLV